MRYYLYGKWVVSESLVIADKHMFYKCSCYFRLHTKLNL